jgi:hypothetical protein
MWRKILYADKLSIWISEQCNCLNLQNLLEFVLFVQPKILSILGWDFIDMERMSLAISKIFSDFFGSLNYCFWILQNIRICVARDTICGFHIIWYFEI